MGDVAMTIPVIDSFARNNPDVEITMLSSPKFAPLFEQIPHLTFFPVDTKKEYKDVGGIWKLFQKLKREKQYDCVIDLHDVLRSKLLRTLFKLSGVPVFKIDKGREEKRALTREERKELKPLKSTIQRYEETFIRAGYPIKTAFEGLYKETVLLSPSIKNVLGEKREKWLAIAPFAQHQGKIFPLNKMEELIQHYTRNTSTKIILFGGGKNEQQKLEEWAKNYPNTISIAGKFDIQEELQILQQCDALLSMDSSNMHFASLVKTPVVSIWGATHPFAGFYGYQQDPEDAVQLDLACRPCSIYGNKPCKKGNYPCLNNIDNNAIISKLNKYI